MIKKIVKILVLLLLVLTIGAWFFIRNNKPVYSEELKLDNLKELVPPASNRH